MEVSERTPIEDSSSTMQHSRGFYPLDPISLKDFGLRQKHDATLSRIRAVRPHFLEGFWAPPGTGHNPIEDQGSQTLFPQRILGSAGPGARPYRGSGLSDPISSKDVGLHRAGTTTLSRIRALRSHFLEGFQILPARGTTPLEDFFFREYWKA